jgi:hypothetical protein
MNDEFRIWKAIIKQFTNLQPIIIKLKHGSI